MHVNRLLLRYILIFLIGVIAFSCKRKAPEPDNQGIIEYKIIYLQDGIGNYSSGILPQSMTMTYRGDKIKSSIEGAMGFFHLVNIADLSEYTNTTFLKFIDKRYVYSGKKKEDPCCIGLQNSLEITFTDNTKEILGYSCKEAIVSFPETDRHSFPVYYTTEIDIKKPNSTSPFKEIPGVLMEFQTTLGQSDIMMVAEKVRQVAIPEKEFELLQNYKTVNKIEMESIFNALLE